MAAVDAEAIREALRCGRSGCLSGLAPHHAEQLAASAVAEAVAAERGYHTVTDKAHLARLGFRKYQQVVPGLLVPLYGVDDGQRWGYQYKADNARSNAAGKPVKYDSPQGQANRLDVPPQCRESLVRVVSP